MSKNIHILARVSCVPGEPDRYRALCGYESDKKSEFHQDATRARKRAGALPITVQIVDCPDCLSLSGIGLNTMEINYELR